MTGRDWASEANIPTRPDGGRDWAAEVAPPNPRTAGRNGFPVGSVADLTLNPEEQRRAFESAVTKLKAGKSLTPQEAGALAQASAVQRNLAGVAWAIQPLQFLSDLTKGVIGEAQGTAGSGTRGLQAAGSHLTYGLAEKLPGMAGAASRGVTGAELLRGTKYADDKLAALAVEVFADPSMLLTGAGFVAKSAGMAGRLAQLEKLAATPAGAAKIRDALRTANTVGEKLLVAGDEVTGVPAALRGAAKTKPVQAARGQLSKLADTQLPNVPGAAAIRREGGGTVGDAFLTPDQKASIYTPEQLARDEFRAGVRQTADNTTTAIKDAALADAKVVQDITRGLPTADAAEVNRLLGVFTTATDPKIAAEALRKLGVISTRVGKDLEQPFVAAVKAADRVGQQTLGAQLRAEGLPAVIDPAVTKAIQDAQSGADLVAQVGKYATVAGRPRGILMTQYVGRNDIPTTITRLAEQVEIPAVTTVDASRVALTVDQAAPTVPVPRQPVEPVGVPAQGEMPVNPASTAQRVTAQPVTPTTVPPNTATVSPADVLEGLFMGKRQAAPPLRPWEPETLKDGMAVYRGEIDPNGLAGMGDNMERIGPAQHALPPEEYAARVQQVKDLQTQVPVLEAEVKRLDDILTTRGWDPQTSLDKIKAQGMLSEAKIRLDVAEASIARQAAAEAKDAQEVARIAAADAEAQKHRDVLYVSPDREVAESYAEGVLTDATGAVRDLVMKPQNMLDIRPLADKSGYLRTRDDMTKVFDTIGMTADEQTKAFKILADEGWTPDSGRGLASYELMRGEMTGLVKNALRREGYDALRYQEIWQDNIALIDRSRAAEVLPDGTLKPTSPDVVPFNRVTPQNVLEGLLTGKATTPTTDASGVPAVPPGYPTSALTDDRIMGDVLTGAVMPAPEGTVLPKLNTTPVRGVLKDGQRVDFEVGAWIYEPATKKDPATLNLQVDANLPNGSGAGVVFMTSYDLGKTWEPQMVRSYLPRQGVATTLYDYAFKHLGLTESTAYRGPRWDDGTAFRATYDQRPPEATTLEPAPVAAPTPEPVPTARPVLSTADLPKTPQQVLADLMAPKPADPLTVLPERGFQPTDPTVSKAVALPATAPERLVQKAIPTTYRTVSADANALDWASLPDNAARRAVLNAIPDARGATFVRDAQGALRLNQSDITVPLGHPTIGQYFPDQAILDAQRQGTTLGERTVVNRESVPEWFDPKGPPLDVQRGLHEQAVRDAAEAQYPNQYAAAMSLREAHEDTSWILGDAFASFERVARPDLVNTRAASNQYAQRVAQYAGRPATRGEVFQYRLQLARYRQARNLADLKGDEVAQHLTDFYRANPDAMLYDAVLSTARAFDLGTAGAKHLRTLLKRSENGVLRDLSTLERMEFGQYLLGKEAGKRGTGAGLLVDRLQRNPEAVSREFEQVFEQDVNALRLIDEQVRTRSAAIVRAQAFKQYRGYLEGTGQLITEKKLLELRNTPESRLTPDQLEMRRNAASAVTVSGKKAGWYRIESDVPGYFQKGDVIPWWAAFDLMPAKVVGDAGVAASTLGRGGLDVYNRLWSSMNARLLGSVTSLVNDQIGQFLQMALWGVTPDAVIEGVIRRATAGPDELRAMRESGIHSAKLEANLGSSREELTRLAARLDGDTDLTRMQRVIDGVIRFTERSSGVDRTAMTGVAGGVADVAGFGSAYVFQLRSAMSDLQRESLWFHRRALGDSPAQAARYANDVLMDMRLVPAYARVIRKWWPFFNWIAMSGPRSVLTVLRKPGVNAAYQRLPQASDNPDDPKDATRRLLARDGGWINLGVSGQGSTRVYLDPKNWSPLNTIPQLIDWRNTTVGAVDLPWMVNLPMTVQGGTDRFGRNIYSSVLDGGTGGFIEAYAKDPKRTLLIAVKTVAGQFNPSYAPGSPRAQALARSLIAAGQLPQDGSKDLAIAHTLVGTPWGRAWLAYMQNGVTAPLEPDPLGTRESPYSTPPAGVGVALGNFAVPLKEVNADQGEQGAAMQALSVGQLEFSSWLAAQKKRLAELEAGGATPERLRAEENRIQREADVRGARLDMLDTITR